MDAFWEFVNKRSVRFVLAAFCILLAIQGVYGIVIARNGWDLFAGDGRNRVMGGMGTGQSPSGPGQGHAKTEYCRQYRYCHVIDQLVCRPLSYHGNTGMSPGSLSLNRQNRGYFLWQKKKANSRIR